MHLIDSDKPGGRELLCGTLGMLNPKSPFKEEQVDTWFLWFLNILCDFFIETLN